MPADSHRRRRAIAAASVAGLPLLNRSLAAEPDSPRFYALASGTAATWTIGALASGRIDVGKPKLGAAAALGVAAFGGFWCAAKVIRYVPILDRAVGGALSHANEGSKPKALATALITGASEELFFRGAIHDALPKEHRVELTTGVYIAATLATGNPALVLAAAVMGLLFAWERERSGGIVEPLTTHLTWSTLMLLGLSPMYQDPARHQG